MIQNNWSEKIDVFLANYERLQKPENNKGYRFNLLADQCGSILECSHTKFLLRLLQYRNQYGFPFLKEFIAMAGFDIQVDSHDIQFNTEYFGRNDKDSTCPTGRLDGFIYQKDVFAFIIENKINHAGNQTEQIKRYIEIVHNSLRFSKEQIYVVFLTRDGLESPDEISKECMVSYGICNPEEKCEDSDAFVLSGPRYFACSYAGNILDWLKESIQPSVAQKEVVLNAGLIQYIDYLEGMLGIYDNGLKRECWKWFDEKIHLDGDETNQNAILYDFYMWLDREYLKDKDDVNMDGINMLKNIINEKNDELMGTFLSITKDYFTSGKKPLMKKFHLNHHFTYYYITFCDKEWQKGIQFGWYPLGMKKLNEAKELSFCLKIQGKELNLDSKLGRKLRELGYKYHEKSKTYKIKICVPQFEGKSTFFAMDDKEKTSFLTKVYQNYAYPLIYIIQSSFE